MLQHNVWCVCVLCGEVCWITLPYRGLRLALVTFIPATGSFRANGHNKTELLFIVPEIFYVSIIGC